MYKSSAGLALTTLTPLLGLLGVNQSLNIYNRDFKRDSPKKLYPITERNIKRLIKTKTGEDFKIDYWKFNTPNAGVSKDTLYLGYEEIRAINQYLTYSEEPKTLKGHERTINDFTQYLLGRIEDSGYLLRDTDEHSDLEYYTEGSTSYSLDKPEKFYDRNMILGLLYHEMGHIKGKHVVKKQQLRQKMVIGTFLATITSVGTIGMGLYFGMNPILVASGVMMTGPSTILGTGIGLYLYEKKRSRDFEREADFNITDQDLIKSDIRLRKKMQQTYPISKSNLDSTHPSNLDRIKYQQKRLRFSKRRVSKKSKSAKRTKRTKRTNPKLWEKVVQKVKKGSKGGLSGQWSARKAQLAVAEYKKKGGSYIGKKSKSNSLVKWTRQDWRTKSGKPSVVGSDATGERYLPAKAIKKLSEKEYQKTSRAKRRSIKKGKQYSKQPKRISKKTKKYRNQELKKKRSSKRSSKQP
jgi:hypothetical protein